MRGLALALVPVAVLLAVDALALAVLRPAFPPVRRAWLRRLGRTLYFLVTPTILAAVLLVLRAEEARLRPTMALFGVVTLVYLPKVAVLLSAAVAAVLLTPWLLARAYRARGAPVRPEVLAWRLRPVAMGAAACGGVVLLALAHAMTLGRGAVAVRRQVLVLPGLPTGLDGLRLVHLSDIHVSSLPAGAFVERLVRAVKALEPDLVVLTGDFGPPGDASTAPELLGRVRGSLGSVAALGNHDLIGPGLADADRPPTGREKAARASRYRAWLAARGWTLLENDAVVLERGGVRLGILGLGVDDPHHGFADANLPRALEASDGADFRVLLMHNPETWDREVVGRRPIGLALAGHTHAGQVALEIGPVRWDLARVRFPRSHGLYRCGGQALHVSAGIGDVFLPFRLGCPPEITLLELRASTPGPTTRGRA